jgi:hypothetical protein
LGDICILAEAAPEITADRGDGIGQTARVEVKQGLFLDRIDIAGDQPAIYQRRQLPVPVFTHTANTPPVRFDEATMTAQVASDLSVVERLVQIGFHDKIAPLFFKRLRRSLFFYFAVQLGPDP